MHVLNRTRSQSPYLCQEIPRGGAATGSPPHIPEHFQFSHRQGTVMTDIILVSFQFRPVIIQ